MLISRLLSKGHELWMLERRDSFAVHNHDMGRKSNFLVLALLVPAIWFLGTSYDAATDASALGELNAGDTAWMVVASAFV